MRKVTNQLLQMMDDGVISPKVIAEACMHYMSEDEVADMARENDIIFDSEDEEEE